MKINVYEKRRPKENRKYSTFVSFPYCSTFYVLPIFFIFLSFCQIPKCALRHELFLNARLSVQQCTTGLLIVYLRFTFKYV